MKTAARNPHQGSSFESWLDEEGIRAEVEAAALKKVIAYLFRAKMETRAVNSAALAAKLGTSRAAVNRILDEKNTAITLNTLTRAAAALGCRVRFEVVG